MLMSDTGFGTNHDRSPTHCEDPLRPVIETAIWRLAPPVSRTPVATHHDSRTVDCEAIGAKELATSQSHVRVLLHRTYQNLCVLRIEFDVWVEYQHETDVGTTLGARALHDAVRPRPESAVRTRIPGHIGEGQARGFELWRIRIAINNKYELRRPGLTLHALEAAPEIVIGAVIHNSYGVVQVRAICSI